MNATNSLCQIDNSRIFQNWKTKLNLKQVQSHGIILLDHPEFKIEFTFINVNTLTKKKKKKKKKTRQKWVYFLAHLKIVADLNASLIQWRTDRKKKIKVRLTNC